MGDVIDEYGLYPSTKPYEYIKQNEIGDANHTDMILANETNHPIRRWITFKSFDILPFESERQNSLASESDK